MVSVCKQSSCTYTTACDPPYSPLHKWKIFEASYNAAFGKLWEEECCTWAMPGFEPEAATSHFSMFYRDWNKHISKDAKSTPQGCREHALNCKAPLQAVKGHAQAGTWILAQLFKEAQGSSEETLL